MLLCACEGKLSALQECEADTFCDFFPTLQRGTEILITRWAKLQLPTGQKYNSAWKKLQKPLKERRMACNVKVCFPCIFVWPLCIDWLSECTRYVWVVKYVSWKSISLYTLTVTQSSQRRASIWALCSYPCSPSQMNHYFPFPWKHFGLVNTKVMMYSSSSTSRPYKLLLRWYHTWWKYQDFPYLNTSSL